MKQTISSLLQKMTSSLSKKLFIAGIAVTSITSSAFAGGEEANAKAVSNLKSEYKNAQNVEWKVTPEYTKATFTWNGQHCEVFYNNDGETIAETRFINMNNLPLRAQQYITKKYADYNPTAAFEVNSVEKGLNYYVSITKNDKNQLLEVTPNGDVSIYRP